MKIKKLEGSLFLPFGVERKGEIALILPIWVAGLPGKNGHGIYQYIWYIYNSNQRQLLGTRKVGWMAAPRGY